MTSGDIKDNYEYSRKQRLVFMKDGSNSFEIEYEAKTCKIDLKHHPFVTNYTHV